MVRLTFFIGLLIILLPGRFCNKLLAQEITVSDFFPEIKILEFNEPAPGYYFMGSKGLTASGAEHYITIIDNYGTPVFFRKMEKATSSFRLLENGRLAYLYGVPRKLYFLNEMLEVEGSVNVQGFKPNGHDWDIDSNGNILLMGEDSRTVDMSLLVEGGDTNATVIELVVQEFDSEFNLLYTWNSADHFEIMDGNENSSYVDYTKSQIDYVHGNAISIDSDTSFIISCRHMDEITKIDRRTGEIIWRLGGKNNQFEFVNDTIGFSHQHSVRALENGNILMFDNGNLHDPQVSSAVEYKIDEIKRTATLVKRYYRDSETYTNHQGTTQRIYNGNTLINWGPYWPSLTEFASDGSITLEWDFTEHSFCPRIEKYLWETKVFDLNSDSLVFDLLAQPDKMESNITVYNNSMEELILSGVHSNTNCFFVNNEWPLSIADGDSAILSVQFKSENMENDFVQDVLTICSDSENQRIAQQLFVTGIVEDNKTPVTDYSKMYEFQIFPNPFSGELNIVSNHSCNDIQIKIFSITGSLVYENAGVDLPVYKLNIRNLKSGVFIIKLYSRLEEEIYSGKLVVKER